jgi:hypothetical protein
MKNLLSLRTLAILLTFALSVSLAARARASHTTCTTAQLRTQCESSELSPIMKAATHEALYQALQHYGEEHYPVGICHNAKLTSTTPVSRCLFDGGESLIKFFTGKYLKAQVKGHEEIQCLYSSTVVNDALYSDKIPKTDPQTGRDHRLTIGELEDLIFLYAAESSCPLP